MRKQVPTLLFLGHEPSVETVSLFRSISSAIGLQFRLILQKVHFSDFSQVWTLP
jgi:hypothetical protein